MSTKGRGGRFVKPLPQENVIDSTEDHLSNGKSTSNGNENITNPAVGAERPKRGRKVPPTEKNEEPKAKNTKSAKLDETEAESVKSEGAASSSSSSVQPTSARGRKTTSSKQENSPPVTKRAPKRGAPSTEPSLAKGRNVTSKNGKTNAKLETVNENESDGSSSSSAQPALSTKEQKATSSRKELPPATNKLTTKESSESPLSAQAVSERKKTSKNGKTSTARSTKLTNNEAEAESVKSDGSSSSAATPAPSARGRKATSSKKKLSPAANKVARKESSESSLSVQPVATARGRNVTSRTAKTNAAQKAKLEAHSEAEEDSDKSSSSPAPPAKGRKATSSKKELSSAAKKPTKKESIKANPKNGVQPEEEDDRPVNRRRKRGGSEVEEDDEIDEKKSKSTPKKAAPPKKGSKMNSTETLYNEMDFSSDKTFNLKISSWNVAGLRAWISKGGQDYVKYEKPDIICLQEIKCIPENVPEEACFPGYHPYWLCQPGGHAGVAIYSKIMPINVTYGIGDEEQDTDGRIITAEYEKFHLICVYVPNAGRKLVTLPKRMRWDKIFHEYVEKLNASKPVIICGDMNVAHNEIDLANPKGNRRNAGFTQEERDGMTKLLSLGYIDTYRFLNPDQEKVYTFWTYMANARAKNVGWRLDYFILSERIQSKLVDNVVRSKVLGSDHCPITLFLNI